MGTVQLAPFLFKLALIFMPGIIARVILGQLLYYKSDDSFSFSIHSFVLGSFSYFFLYILLSLLSAIPCLDIKVSELMMFNSATDDKVLVNYKEVMLACAMSVPVAFAISYAEQNKWLSRVATKLKVTNRFSEPDLWGYLFNSPDLSSSPWVTIRNKKNNLMYQGSVSAFSDTVADAEVYITDVQVYNNTTGDLLYSVPGVYLTFEHGEIEIEFHLGANTKKGGNE